MCIIIIIISSSSSSAIIVIINIGVIYFTGTTLYYCD